MEYIKPSENDEMATFGGGCFWCMEACFKEHPGIVKAVSGYAGGSTKSPTV